MLKFSQRIKQAWTCFLHGMPSAPVPMDIFTLMNMAYVGQALFVITKLGVLDLLAEGPETINHLAQLTDADETRLTQIMRALAGWNVLAKDQSDRYHLTSMSSFLTDPASCLRQFILLWGEHYYHIAGQMFTHTQYGRPNIESNDGHDTEAIWASLYARPDKAKLFIDFMERVTDMHSSVIVSSYNFSSNRLVIDVGGGRASLISAVLKAYPHLRGVVVDLPHMKTEVSLRLDSEGLTERCSFSEGNFLEHVPAGGDVYIIKHVLHDWPDTEVSTILSNISKVMNENDVLIIIEGLIHEENGNEELLKLQNLERMLLTDGRERSEDEFNSLLMGVELRLAEVRYTSFNDCCLIIARKNKH